METKKSLEDELSRILADANWDGPFNASWYRLILEGWVGKQPKDRHVVMVHLLTDIFASHLPEQQVTDRRCVSRSNWCGHMYKIGERYGLSFSILWEALEQLGLQGLISIHKEKRPKPGGRSPAVWVRVLPVPEAIRRITVAPAQDDGWGFTPVRRVTVSRRSADRRTTA